MTASNVVRVAMIGFGEVGTAFSRGFLTAGGYEVAAWDILMAGETVRHAADGS